VSRLEVAVAAFLANLGIDVQEVDVDENAVSAD
jgi:hypothetical protein